MMTGQPWSVKGIDPKAREAAKDLARRSGMTLGEWLNQVILEDGLSDDPVMPPEASVNRRSALARAPFRRAEPAPHTRDEILRVSETLDTLASRIEAAESRTAQVVGGVDKSVTALVARLDGAEQDSANTAARFEDVAEELRADQARLHERLQGADPGSAEAETREVLSALRGDLDGVVSRLEAIPEDNAVMVESVIARIAERLEQAKLAPPTPCKAWSPPLANLSAGWALRKPNSPTSPLGWSRSPPTSPPASKRPARKWPKTLRWLPTAVSTAWSGRCRK